MLDFLKKSYPFNYNIKHRLKIIAGISIGILLFLIFYQPFDTGNLNYTDKNILYIGGAAITSLALFINLILLPSFFPKIFLNGKWNIGKEILWNLWILFTIGCFFLVYSNITGLFEVNFYFIIKILLFSILPVGILITINQDRLLKSHLKHAIKLNQKLATQPKSVVEKPEIICFTGSNNKDKLELNVREILYIQSANNYIEILWKDNNTINRTLLRSTFTKAFEITKGYTTLFRCHRTFIVNIDNISKLEGNSQGYKLYFDHINHFIPVSRTYTNAFKKIINK